MAECPNKGNNQEKCPCTSTDCPNHSICCECVRNHREHGGMPACLRKVTP